MLLLLSSRTNSRPTPSRSVAAFDFPARASFMSYSFGMRLGAGAFRRHPRLGGGCGLPRACKVRRPLFQKGGKRLPCLVGADLDAERLVLQLHRGFGPIAEC